MPLTFLVPGAPTATVTATIGGEIDLATVPELRGHVDEVLAETAVTGIVLDLSEVTFLDSTGIGALINCRSRAHQAGKTLRVANPRGLVREVLTLTNVLPMLTTEA